MNRRVTRAGKINGTVRVPGDKSIAHRALILGSVARGEQIVHGLPLADDVASTASCLRSLGCAVEEMPGDKIRVSPGRWKSSATIDAGNSGTTARLLAGLVAGLGIDCTIDGDASLRRRPMERIAEPLRLMGAEVTTASDGCLPMRIRATGLDGIVYHPPMASAQVKSAVLLAGLNATGETTIVEKAPTRDHTELMLGAMGASLSRQANTITVTGQSPLGAVTVGVPGDISSAAFFMAAAAICPGSEVRVNSTGINPTRTGALRVLQGMGARIAMENNTTSAGEPTADIIVRSSSLEGVVIDGAIIPSLIDELPLLAVTATQARGTTVVRGAGELRHKESDRIRCMVDNLARLGAVVEELDDGFIIKGPCALRGATVESFGDHRIAMAMAVAGLVAEGATTIEDADAVDISYPEFLRDLDRLVS